MSERLDRLDAFRILRETIKKNYGTQRNFAQENDLREQDVSDALNGRRPLSAAMLKACGLRRIEYFERVEVEHEAA
ncbi:helix-turn-helix domain-containing protein [Gluconobacter albidus]|uniref:hypothetical protein n=1 Tax=Gluconobacter albidus TaxID=318683 RepID=UPI001B8B7B89|nr:hypothetical protein [Gluconobacter albidus]MBS1029228.1 hypothetical protein [Gluconobacter albidus]